MQDTPQAPDTHGLRFRVADAGDRPAIVALLNAAYRGDSSRAGWTTEADLLGGQRTDADEVGALIAAPDSRFLLGLDGPALVGCVHLARDRHAAWLGMFAIQPGLQGKGLGRRFLEAAEDRVRKWWGSTCMRMSVISLREELIGYYERRGYRRTGETVPFPVDDPRFGIPRVETLEFAILEKSLAPHA